MLFTAYAFGVSLNRPVVTLMAYLTLPVLNNSTPKELLLTTNAWRYFIGLPMIICVLFIIGMLLVVRLDTPMFLIS
jgi:hypothetical protein